jgi:L-serine dehydratase
MISLLDIIGPVMVGPSSSHTAGACRLGLLARAILDGRPEKALVELHGSFARTGLGHGTDRAIAGGLLGLLPDDGRLRESLEIADRMDLALSFTAVRLRGAHHPNTARMTLWAGREKVVVTGASLGAGRVRAVDIDGFPVDITGEYPALVLLAHDEPGIVATTSGILAREGANIAAVRVSRRRKGGEAIHVYELDGPASAAALEAIRALPAVRRCRAIERIS